MDWSGEWWVVILGAGFVFIVAGTLYLTRSRAFTFRSAAAQLGFINLQGLNPLSDDEKKGLKLFSRGSDGKTANMFGDRVDAPSLLLFDFAYSFGGPPHPSARHHQTVAAFKAPVDGIPDFQMTPASALDGAAPQFGPQAIRFDSRPDFGQKYCLRAESEAAVRAFFGDSFFDRLTTADPAGAWSVEKAGRWLLVYRHNVLFSPKAIPESWHAARGLGKLFLEPH